MNPETKKILKKSLEDLQKDRKKVLEELTNTGREIGRAETKKKELESKLTTLDHRISEISKDING